MDTKEFTPDTLLEAVRYFSDLDVCHRYMVGIKWPDGKITCPKCGGANVGEIANRRLFQCKAKGCRKQFSTKVGTIFEDSPLGLDKWFVAVWSIANAKNGISSHELHRALGVTQKSCWFMLHRVRLAMRTGTFKKISGTVESDESFIGGKAINMHAGKRKVIGRGSVGKAIVHGLLERAKGDELSRVDATVVGDNGRITVQGRVRKNVAPGSEVYTDALKSYSGLNDQYFHAMVNHSVEYVRGAVHTNGLENFWSLLKRMLKGTYIAVQPQHLNAYLDEEVCRFNARKGTDRTRFQEVMGRVTGRRITYAELTGAATA